MNEIVENKKYFKQFDKILKWRTNNILFKKNNGIFKKNNGIFKKNKDNENLEKTQTIDYQTMQKKLSYEEHRRNHIMSVAQAYK
jgi:hypothetical protein